MDRIIRVHGGETREICLISLFRALSFCFDYIDFFEKDHRNEIVEKSIFPYLDSITAATQKGEIDIDHITDLLARIVFDWRIRYTQFLEPPRAVTIEERKVTVTEETRKKLSESVEKALEKEVK
jgi:hypothetical protein